MKNFKDMDIFSKPGTKVMFMNSQGGEYHRAHAINWGLVEGEIYEVSYVQIGNLYSEVYLVDYPGCSFNTVMFMEVKDEEFCECEFNSLPEGKESPFQAFGQGVVDFSVGVIPVNHSMAICTEEGAIYIDKDQAATFFELVETNPEITQVVKLHAAIKEGKDIEIQLDIPWYDHDSGHHQINKTWVRVDPEQIKFKYLMEYRVKSS
jgi:hypothetical protein